jgi:ABC-type branched-subunit amino acid transport system ATPase component
MALAAKPRLLPLDEPTGGMSLEERRVTGELLQLQLDGVSGQVREGRQVPLAAYREWRLLQF